MVQIIRDWETVYFTAFSKDKSKNTTIELSLNRSGGTYSMCTKHQEHVSFKDNDIELTELKLEALKKAIAFLKNELDS